MPLGAADREILFGTPLPTKQIELYLAKQQNCTSSISDLRNAFADLSAGCFHSALIALKTRGVIETEGDSISLVGGGDTGLSKSDMVWKAIRIERSFTVDRIASMTGLSITTVRHILNSFEKENIVRAVSRSKGKPTVYLFASEAVVRPKKKSKRTGTESESIWNAVRSMRKDFTVQNLAKKLKAGNDRYVRMLVRQYRQDGLIELAYVDRNPSKPKVYRLTEKGRDMKETPVVRYEVSESIITEEEGSNG